MKKNNLRILIICILWIQNLFAVFSQNMNNITTGDLSYPDPVSNLSPNADAFQNLNVDLFQGNCNLNVPIYEYKSRKLSLPITMNYSPPLKNIGNIYHPGWTGLGWHLSAGGAITRVVRGIPDETAKTSSGSYFWPNYDNSQWDANEDEFSFNFCGYSGKFFCHNGKWIVTSSANIISILPIFVGNSSTRLTGFNLQMPDGVIYSFGYSYSNPPDFDYAVEYSCAFDSNTQQPVSWFLSNIQSPEGDLIHFRYERGETICSLPLNNCSVTAIYREYKNPYPNQDLPTYTEYYTNSIENKHNIRIYPSYLREITNYNNNQRIEFDRSIANEKDYPSFYYPTNVNSSDFHWNKLDTIRIIDTNINRCFKKYSLNYLENSTEILRLLSVQEIGVTGSNVEISKPAYSFNYDETLQKMTYPTGGFAVFEYEGHVCEGYDGYLKGYRIKSITSYSAENETPWITEYHYVKEGSFLDGTGTSSGVLSREEIGVKGFSFSAIFGNVQWEKNTNYDLSPYAGEVESKRVGYSSVYVIKKKGSTESERTHYMFTNYHDEGISSHNQAWAGKLLRVNSYGSSGTLRRTDYDYNDPGRMYDTIQHRTVEYLPFKARGGIYSYKLTTTADDDYYCRTFKPKRIIEYEDGAMTDTLLVTTLTYNQETGCITRKEVVNRKEGDNYITDYKYRWNTLIDIYHDAARRINMPYETTVKKNGKIIAAEVTQFADIYNSGSQISFVMPIKKYLLSITAPIDNYIAATYGTGVGTLDSRCKLEVTYKYDTEGRVIESQHTGQLPVSFIWGTDELDAEIKGVGYLDAIQVNSNHQIGYDFNGFQKFRRWLPNAQITSYTYNEHGLTSITDANGSTQYVEYDVFGQPVRMKDDTGNILKSVQYNYNINP
jgi:YD repeat-containing protein